MTTFAVFLGAIGTLVLAIIGLIGVTIGVLALAEWFVRQPADEWNELDEWRRKVDAMRRLNDDGDAA